MRSSFKRASQGAPAPTTEQIEQPVAKSASPTYESLTAIKMVDDDLDGDVILGQIRALPVRSLRAAEKQMRAGNK